MESQCEYYMYFPAVPITDLSDPARYRSLPRRSHLYLGETVRFLLVLRCREGAATPTDRSPESASSQAWRELAGSLCAVASVSPGESSRHRGNHQPHHHDYLSSGDEAICRSFRDCKPLLIHNSSGTATREFRRAPVQSPLDEPVVLTDEVIFPLTVSLDKLPVSTLKVKVMVTVWKREAEKAEVQELGYLSVLQQREPTHTFRHDLNTFKAQVSTTLTVLPPPTVHCKQMTVSGKHIAVVKVLNDSSQDEVSIRDIRILPNLNASYLPMMPDGSVLLVDNVCHQSGEVGMASFCRVDSLASHLPRMLSTLDERFFFFQRRPNSSLLRYISCPGSLCRLSSSSSRHQIRQLILVNFQLVSSKTFVLLGQISPQLLTKSKKRTTSTRVNNLDQTVTPIKVSPTAVPHVNVNVCSGRGQSDDSSLSAVICHTPLSNLGQCRKGSTLSFSVAFQILKPGLYELSQHMKLKLQFTASVSNPPPDARPLSRKNSPSSPAVRDLLDRHQASLGRSQSFSHQQPSRSHIMRTGSAMERRAITPPVGSPVGRPLYLPPQDKSLLSLDKIAKRECKVLVVDPVS
uniref:Trafficking protein particle complex subunit 14 n=2 Tax=Tetraodon nigroviridis TaxID=99883 RepID=H3CI98_TETNG